MAILKSMFEYVKNVNSKTNDRDRKLATAFGDCYRNDLCACCNHPFMETEESWYWYYQNGTMRMHLQCYIDWYDKAAKIDYNKVKEKLENS